jgi:hypothetical protein
LIDPRALDENENLLSPQEMAQYEGELAWPERFDHEHDKATEYELSNIANAGQYQQSPVPRKGGIIKREYWMDYLPTREGKFPDMEFVCVSVDPAFTEKEENDPTGCTTWGVWTDPEDGFPKGPIPRTASPRSCCSPPGASTSRFMASSRSRGRAPRARRNSRLELQPVWRRRCLLDRGPGLWRMTS